VRYCPTEQKADVFTKPLQGALFKCFQRVIVMGLDHISDLWHANSLETEECVEFWQDLSKT